MSANLKSGAKDVGCRNWINETVEYGALVSAVTRVAHPKLYEAGRDTLVAMQRHPDLVEVAREWSSVYNAVSVVSNRHCPIHRDVGTNAAWYDCLTTIGGDSDMEMHWPALGVSLAYRSGTSVLFSGYTIAHTVSKSESERVCFAHYMKDNVHETFGIADPGWMDLHTYRNVL